MAREVSGDESSAVRNVLTDGFMPLRLFILILAVDYALNGAIYRLIMAVVP